MRAGLEITRPKTYSIFDSAPYRNLDVRCRFSQENGASQELQTSTSESKVL